LEGLTFFDLLYVSRVLIKVIKIVHSRRTKTKQKLNLFIGETKSLEVVCNVAT